MKEEKHKINDQVTLIISRDSISKTSYASLVWGNTYTEEITLNVADLILSLQGKNLNNI